MSYLRNLLLGLGTTVLAGIATIAAGTEGPAAVASIKPIHSLLAGVMEGAGQPALLVRGGASPHTYALRPSDAHRLEHAELVVWVGEEAESFLVQPIDALAGDACVLELSRLEGITLLRMRAGGAWDEHGHGGETQGPDGDAHGPAGEGEDHGEEDEPEHRGKCAGEREGRREHEPAGPRDDPEEARHVHHEDGHGHEHQGGEYNMHLWLDPANAAVIAGAMAGALSRLDPDRASLYRENEAALKARLRVLDDELKEAFAPVLDRGFIVFHDAWQYLDTRYGLRAVGSVTVSPDQSPGAARLSEIREKITGAEATCVFAEPQFEPRLVRTLVDGTGAGTGTLDPLGAALEDGPDLYFDLMWANARAFRACFGR